MRAMPRRSSAIDAADERPILVDRIQPGKNLGSGARRRISKSTLVSSRTFLARRHAADRGRDRDRRLQQRGGSNTVKRVVIESEKDTRKGIAMTEVNAVLASVSPIFVKVIKTLHSGYQLPDPLPWAALAGPLVAAEVFGPARRAARKSPIHNGSVARTSLFGRLCQPMAGRRARPPGRPRSPRRRHGRPRSDPRTHPRPCRAARPPPHRRGEAGLGVVGAGFAGLRGRGGKGDPEGGYQLRGERGHRIRRGCIGRGGGVGADRSRHRRPVGRCLRCGRCGNRQGPPNAGRRDRQPGEATARARPTRLRARLGRGRTDRRWRTVIEQARTFRRRWRRRSPPTRGPRSSRCNTHPGSGGCSPPRCCASAAKPAGTCHASMTALKPSRGSGGGRARALGGSPSSSRQSRPRPRPGSRITTAG